MSDISSPLPWKLDERYIVADMPGGRPGGEVIAQCQPTIMAGERYPTAVRLANATLIVRRVNQGPAFELMMVAAQGMDLDCLCDVLNPCILSNEPGKHWGGGDACSNCKMRAALKLAQGAR